MNIELNRKLLFSEDDKTLSYLTRLLTILEDAPHKLWHDLETSQVETLPWYRWCNTYDKKRLKLRLSHPEVADKTLLTLQIQRDTDPNSPGKLCMSPKDALDFLQAPVYLVVENFQYDSPFIAYILRRFAQRILKGADEHYWQTLSYCLSNPSLQALPLAFKHGGGDTTGQICSELLDATIPSRVMVVVDRDARWPDESQQGKDPDLDSTFQIVQLPAGSTGKKVFKLNRSPRLSRYTLERRERENYIPHEFIEKKFKGEKEKERLRAYKSLCPKAQHCWDVKDGLKASLKKEAQGECKSLHAADLWKEARECMFWREHCDEPTREALWEGFGDMKSAWTDANLLDSFQFDDAIKREAERIAMKLVRLL